MYDEYIIRFQVHIYDEKIEFDSIIEILPLKFLKVEYLIETNSNEMLFFCLTRGNQNEILVVEEEESFYQWLQEFRKRCIMSCFRHLYKVREELGEGAFAKVVKCQSVEDEREVAVKIYQKDLILNSDDSEDHIVSFHLLKLFFQKGIKTEINLLQQLEHKNIIRIQEVYEGKNHIYFVLDYINGGELSQKLKKKIIYSEQEAANFMKSVLEALSYLHSEGIMHRDIKPTNLMFRNLGSSLDVALIDFGLAEKVDNQKMIFKKCGTPGFIAPEVLRNEKYDTKVDVFSAGVVLYRILTGVKLFNSKNSNETLKLNKECKINFDFPHLSSNTIEYLKLLLNDDPNQRINSTEALNHEWIQQASKLSSWTDSLNTIGYDHTLINQKDLYPNSLKSIKLNVCLQDMQDKQDQLDELPLIFDNQRIEKEKQI